MATLESIIHILNYVNFSITNLSQML